MFFTRVGSYTFTGAKHTHVEPTDAAGDLFKSPNEVALAKIRWDDNFANYDGLLAFIEIGLEGKV